MRLLDGSETYGIQQQGLRLVSDSQFHGTDLGKYDYYLTISKVDGGEGKLTVEFYEYESGRKVSELVTEVDFTLNSPSVFDGDSDTFGVNLAFSIDTL